MQCLAQSEHAYAFSHDSSDVVKTCAQLMVAADFLQLVEDLERKLARRGNDERAEAVQGAPFEAVELLQHLGQQLSALCL